MSRMHLAALVKHTFFDHENSFRMWKCNLYQRKNFTIPYRIVSTGMTSIPSFKKIMGKYKWTDAANHGPDDTTFLLFLKFRKVH
jgi:hypothetical protein